MVALNFQRQFVARIARGAKVQTIRAPRRDGRDPKPKDRLQLYTGMRTKACHKIGDAVCLNVVPVEIDAERVVLGRGAGRSTLDGPYLEWFARLDGFGSWAEFRAFFEARGLPFRGNVILWHRLEVAAGG